MQNSHELVGAELVGLDRLPGQFAAARALLFGADAVEPVVAAQEVAARIADDGVGLLAQGLQHVLAQAVLVGVGRLGVVDAFVDAAAHVLDEAAKEQGRDRGDRSIGVEKDLCC